MRDNVEKVIVLAANRGYTEQLSTTIKSIFYHNKGVKVYVLNQDIMPDWFRKPRQLARMLGGDIIDVKINLQDIAKEWHTLNHITVDAYARYFIPQYVSEDKVLYLDCDLIVNRPLDDVWMTDLQGYPVGAGWDPDNQNFNSGVLLIDNQKWRAEGIIRQLVEETNRMQEAVQKGIIPNFNGDQAVLNKVFENRWILLDKRMNLPVGFDIVGFFSGWSNQFLNSDNPYILHYLSFRKPWSTLVANRYRDLWWRFHDADYGQILEHHMGTFDIGVEKKPVLNFFTFTNSQDIMHIRELVTSFPDARFHIAAYTDMGEKLLQLAIHDNVRLYPQIVPPVLDELLAKTSVYLDINHGSGADFILEKLQANNIPLLAFSNTKHGDYGQLMFDTNEPNSMIKAIQDFMDTGEWQQNLPPKMNFLTMTNSQDLEQIEYLLQALPDYRFHIAAWTDMGPKLTDLAQYSNVSLHPAISQQELTDLQETVDLYLDVNMGGEVPGVLDKMSELGKPIFGFYRTQNGNHDQYLFSSERPEELVAALEGYAETGELPKIAPLPVVKSIDETLDYLIKHQASVIRFGDGEVNLMAGHSIPYQDYDETLDKQLKELVARQSDENLVVCLPEAFDDRFVFTWWAEDFWKKHVDHYDAFYRQLCQGAWYGSTFISRPYIDMADKTKAAGQFEKLKSLWAGRDLLIVEGATSRSGVGNDLFEQAKSIKRIVCSSHHAYHWVDEIEEEILKYADGRLILIMLGPTAKVLAANLAQKGHQALDIGHIDSEYEWLKMGAQTKVKFKHKHTAEYNFDQDIEFIEDATYSQQIVADLSKLPVKTGK